MLKLRPTVALPLLLTILPACSQLEANSDPSLNPKVCNSWETIRASRKDTPETLKQVLGNNVARDAWCSAPPKFASARVRA